MIDGLLKLAEIGLWLKVLDVAAGEAFFPLMGLLLIVLLIVLAWRSPKLPWFNGTLALIVFGMLCMMALATLVIVAWDRKEPAGASQPAKAAVPKPAPLRAPEFDIGG